MMRMRRDGGGVVMRLTTAAEEAGPRTGGAAPGTDPGTVVKGIVCAYCVPVPFFYPGMEAGKKIRIRDPG
jgi:hypothetical protein